MIDHCCRVVNMFRVAASRALSTSARRDGDLVQQAFVKKIKEFGQKGGDLVNTNPEVLYFPYCCNTQLFKKKSRPYCTSAGSPKIIFQTKY